MFMNMIFMIFMLCVYSYLQANIENQVLDLYTIVHSVNFIWSTVAKWGQEKKMGHDKPGNIFYSVFD
ncbi:unnamed protein product [Cuscuta campestris]|uniref:Uncharacterized protein n=1 Tax=Cuscuta campestris TaxID=132261 RepID=A0A484NF28_9ASTE|nr:unnamed protein product [Cuscuta campestris]